MSELIMVDGTPYLIGFFFLVFVGLWIYVRFFLDEERELSF
jgi:hypothetical protein